MTALVLDNTMLANSGKAGVMKPDSNGCYLQPVGAFDAHNLQGTFYPFNEYLKKQFASKDSTIGRLVSQGKLKAEIKHPEYIPGMTLGMYLARMHKIDETQTCAQHTKLILNKDKDDKGRNIIRVDSLVRPTGMFKNVLFDGYNNPEENVTFSIRSILETNNKQVVGVNQIKHLVTFDKVNDQGIEKATKYYSTGMEDFGDGSFLITPEILDEFESIIAKERKMAASTGCESAYLPVDTAMLRTPYGWQKVEKFTPSFSSWESK